MNKIKYFFYLLLQQSAILGIYIFMVLMVLVLSFLTDQSLKLSFLLIRLTFLPLVLFIIFRMFSEYQQIKSLKHHLKINTTDPLQIYYQKLLSQQIEITNQFEIDVNNKERKLVDYLIIWSHEMKLPIASLSLMAEQNDVVDSDQVFIQLLLMQNQLDMLLNYERLNDFNHDLDFKWVSINRVIDKTIKEYSIFFIKKQIIPDIKVGNAKVLTDEKWLLFITKQLMYNALKYADKKTKILIQLKDKELRIVDQGLGISPSDLPRVFERGFTGDNGRIQQAATGMGLYLVKQICKELNLSIKIDSNEKFTTAILTFPNLSN